MTRIFFSPDWGLGRMLAPSVDGRRRAGGAMGNNAMLNCGNHPSDFVHDRPNIHG
jgi:hypothetical protein